MNRSISTLLGLPFHRMTIDQALSDCAAMLADRSNPSYVITANLDFACQAASNKTLRDFIFNADRVLCDGLPIVWLSRLLGAPLPERVAGSDLVPKLLDQCEEVGASVFFLGSDKDTLQDLCTLLAESKPRLRIAGHHSPPMGNVESWDNGTIRQSLKETAPDLLLVALGCPKQEQWIARNYQDLSVPLCIGIGASLDFLVGKQKRAPQILQKAGLEWIWRLCGNPRRLTKRYAADLLFLLRMGWRQWRDTRFRLASPAEDVPSDFSNSQSPSVELVSWTGEAVSDCEDLPTGNSIDRNMLLCDCSMVTRIDAAGLGKLAEMARRMNSERKMFGVLTPSEPVRRSIHSLGMSQQLPMLDSVSDLSSIMARGQKSVWEEDEDWRSSA